MTTPLSMEAARPKVRRGRYGWRCRFGLREQSRVFQPLLDVAGDDIAHRRWQPAARHLRRLHGPTPSGCVPQPALHKRADVMTAAAPR